MTLFVCLFFWACLIFDTMENSLQIKVKIKFADRGKCDLNGHGKSLSFIRGALSSSYLMINHFI